MLPLDGSLYGAPAVDSCSILGVTAPLHPQHCMLGLRPRLKPRPSFLDLIASTQKLHKEKAPSTPGSPINAQDGAPFEFATPPDTIPPALESQRRSSPSAEDFAYSSSPKLQGDVRSTMADVRFRSYGNHQGPC